MKEKMITKTELKERGWTESVIKKYLPEPDELRPNPHYSRGPNMRLYKLSRVEELELTGVVALSLKEAAERSVTMKRNAEKQSEKLHQYIKNLKIIVPKIPEKALFTLACEHYNRFWKQKGAYNKFASPLDCTEDFLYRITVNYLRHELTNYEVELDRMFGKVGCVEGRTLLKNRILDSIAEMYPILEEECWSQKGGSYGAVAH